MKSTRYFVSRKNAFTWLAALMAVGSAVMQILALCFGQRLTGWNVFFQKVLPIWCALGFAFILIVRGPKTLYRSTKPVFWACVYFGQIALDWHMRLAEDPNAANGLGGGYALFGYMRYVIACWVIYLAFYFVYRFFMTGRSKRLLVLQIVTLLPFALLIYDFINSVGALELFGVFDKLANLLLVGALFVATLAMRQFTDGKYHPTWGDRSDGRRVRTIDGMSVVANYIMPNRNGASNSINGKIEISNVERYIHKKRAEGMENFGIFHVILAAYVRSIAKYPGCNRFLSGQRVYQRDEDIQFTMAMKKDMRTDGEETMIKLHLTQTDTTKEIYEKFNKVYEEVKSTPLDSSFDAVAGALASLPGLLLKFVVWVLKVMDYFGKIPKFLLEVSPFHASVIFTSMGSLGIPPILHHLYDFGNLPVFIAVGRKYRKQEIDADGSVVVRRYVDYVMNCDERTVDGFYYATAMKYFHKLLRNPEVLDEPPEEVVRDID
ncbi:MAG: hypothetical protein IJJ99_05850 [Oscillospiraceae bacterium]|nr:hypothetical protein [Oscillospiraceae bacterium]